MRIYKKCPCCGRTIFLVMEMELGSSFGSKDNMLHDNSPIMKRIEKLLTTFLLTWKIVMVKYF